MSRDSRQTRAVLPATLWAQSRIRGARARKAYAIKQLNNSSLAVHSLMPKGNDPANLIAKCAGIKVKGSMALIATSGLRCVELACHLASASRCTPKLYIVDNSRMVVEFWQQIKTVFELMAHPGQLPEFLEKHVYRLPFYIKAARGGRFDSDLPKNSAIEVNSLLVDLFERFGFERVRAVINSAVIIRGDWTDNALFHKIRNICRAIGVESIYAYPSNIPSCLKALGRPGKALASLCSLSLLKPTAAIITDYDSLQGRPGDTYVYASPLSFKVVLQDLGLIERDDHPAEAKQDNSMALLRRIGCLESVVDASIKELNDVESRGGRFSAPP